jgi:hypothetical protein
MPIDTNYSRRDFLKATALTTTAATVGLLPSTSSPNSPKEMNCILIVLVGGPSQIDTWDPKPSAPLEVRGPFKTIPTKVPGVYLSELFPRMASVADRFSIVRSVHHTAAPIHETGLQLMQTGHLFTEERHYPHYGSVVSHLCSRKNSKSANVILPRPIEHLGVSISRGQEGGYSPADEHADPLFVEAKIPERYGNNSLGRDLLRARNLVQSGVRFVTVNMFTSVFGEVTWDCHADRGSLSTTLEDYRSTVCPRFDQGFTALIEDLSQSEMLENTLVVAMGEFGRTPKVNHRGGRDHWPGVWSILFAGGPIQSGQVIGSSDSIGSEPKDNPITPPQVAATIYSALGIDPHLSIQLPDGSTTSLVEANPIPGLLR